jgi:rod shape-determining protein MreB and related proteins
MGLRASLWGGRDLAIDLGTANTLVFVRGEGIVVDEPSVVAIDEVAGEVHAVGHAAQRMIGRTPASISAQRPLRHGVIADFEITEQMLAQFLRQASNGRRSAARLVMCAPSGVTDVEARAIEEAARSAGAREVHLIEEPLAAAIGAGLAIAEPVGQMIVDVGGGTSEVAVLSMGGIVVSRSLRVGGYDLDDLVLSYVKSEHRLAIGTGSAEAIKQQIGSACDDGTAREMEIRGRDLVSGLPRKAMLTSEEVRHALSPAVREIVDAVKSTLDDTPPELGSDIADHGMLLAGGGALLHGFAEHLRAETGIPVGMAESPLTCVALGAGRALEEVETLSSQRRTHARQRGRRRKSSPRFGGNSRHS